MGIVCSSQHRRCFSCSHKILTRLCNSVSIQRVSSAKTKDHHEKMLIPGNFAESLVKVDPKESSLQKGVE